MNRIAPPFLNLSEKQVSGSEWKVDLSNGDTLLDPQFIENWDNGTDLTFSRKIEVNADEALAHLQLTGTGAQLKYIVFCGSGDGVFPLQKAEMASVYFEGGGTHHTVCFEMKGPNLADAVHIDEMIVLSSVPQGTSSPLAPARKGDVVWRDRRKIKLEGDAGRFPMSVVDLGKFLGDEFQNALWYMDIDWSDLNAEFGSAARLYINASKKAFREKFESGDQETCQAVMANVMQLVCSGFIERADEWDEDYSQDAPSSIGSVAFFWLQDAFETIESASNMYRANRSKFDARLSAYAAMTGV